MADSEPVTRRVLFTLREAGGKRMARRCGVKAHSLGRLARSGLSVVDGSVLESAVFGEMCERALPPKHGLRALIKLAGTSRGEQRCARAYEDLLAAPLDEGVRRALEGLVQRFGDGGHSSIMVRASLCGSPAAVGRVDGGPQSVRGVQSAAALCQAVHSLWARSVTAASVEAYSMANLADTSVAVLIHPMHDLRARGFIARRDRFSPWQLGTASRHPPGIRWPERLGLMVPLAEGKRVKQGPAALRNLREQLDEASIESLLEIGERAAADLGDRLMVTFALRDDVDESARVVVLAVQDQVPWNSASDGRVWVEVAVGGGSARPPTPLSHSVLSEVVTASLGDAMAEKGRRISRDALTSFDGRCFADLEEIVGAAAGAAMWGPESTCAAFGGASGPLVASVSGRVAAGRARKMLVPLVGMRWAYEQLGLDRQLEVEQESLATELRELIEVKYALLPSDALSTTLRRARILLRRAVSMWLRVLGVQQSIARAVTLWLGRRVADIDPSLGHALIRGAGAGLAYELARAVGDSAKLLARDPTLLAQLASGEVRSARDLPDVSGRGIVGQCFTQFGDLSCSAFELARPRWREDGRELSAMLAAIAAIDEPLDVMARHQAARAMAERRLADLEPGFNGLERRVLRTLIDRGRHWTRHRAAVDRNVYRALYAMRRIVLDVDRRIARFDEGPAPHALYPRAFLCPLDRLVQALDSGHPDLGRVLRMREADRSSRRQRPILPPAFCGAPVRWGTGDGDDDVFEGMGLSSGVVEGTVRLVHDVPPTQLSADDVLVIRSADVGLSPCFAQAGAVVAERGGMLWPSAELARELALPMVAGIPQVRLRLQNGDRVRVDGSRGKVSRLSGVTGNEG